MRTLRNRSKKTADFRKASSTVCSALTKKLRARLRKDKVSEKQITMIFVLRAALAFLYDATKTFPGASVGMMGLRRDEQTAKPIWYYENIPAVSKKSTIVIFDPMLATGGSGEETLKNLAKRGANMRAVYFVCVIAAPEGISKIAQYMPRENIIAGAIDKGLDAKKFIVPGLGDFGDRYFGTTL